MLRAKCYKQNIYVYVFIYIHNKRLEEFVAKCNSHLWGVWVIFISYHVTVFSKCSTINIYLFYKRKSNS